MAINAFSDKTIEVFETLHYTLIFLEIKKAAWLNAALLCC